MQGFRHPINIQTCSSQGSSEFSDFASGRRSGGGRRRGGGEGELFMASQENHKNDDYESQCKWLVMSSGLIGVSLVVSVEFLVAFLWTLSISFGAQGSRMRRAEDERRLLPLRGRKSTLVYAVYQRRHSNFELPMFSYKSIAQLIKHFRKHKNLTPS